MSTSSPLGLALVHGTPRTFSMHARHSGLAAPTRKIMDHFQPRAGSRSIPIAPHRRRTMIPAHEAVHGVVITAATLGTWRA